jgi:type II secretory pathway component PulM
MTGPYPQDRYAQGQDHTIPIAYPDQRAPRQQRSSRPQMQGAYAIAVLALVAVAVTLAMFLSYKGSASAQLAQMRRQFTTMSQELKNARSANASSYNGLSGKVSSLGTVVGSLANYGMVCTQDLTGQNGPAAFYFPCTDQKP